VVHLEEQAELKCGTWGAVGRDLLKQGVRAGWGPMQRERNGPRRRGAQPTAARAAASSQVVGPGQEVIADCVSQRIARKMVHGQGVLPIVDAVKIDADNNVIDTLSKPLLPIVPHEDSKRFFALMEQLTSWMREERAFWSV
jgi:hypothetical protein